MLRQIAYQLGRAFGSLPMVARIILIVGIVGGVWYYSALPSGVEMREQDAIGPRQLAADQGKQRAATELERVRNECRNSVDSKKQEYSTLVAARKYWDASLVLRTCANALTDASLLKLVADAEIQSHLQSINDTKAQPRNRAQAIEILKRDYLLAISKIMRMV